VKLDYDKDVQPSQHFHPPVRQAPDDLVPPDGTAGNENLLDRRELGTIERVKKIREELNR